MLKRLKSVLKAHLLQLTLKAAIFGGFLAWIKFGDGPRFIPIFLFILASLFFYFRPIADFRRLLSSFLVLLFISFVFIAQAPFAGGSPLLIISVIIGLSAAFFLILGIKNLIFINRQTLYFLLNNLLFFLVFLFFFVAGVGASLIKYLFAFSAIFLLMREFLMFLIPPPGGRQLLFAAVFAFLTLQIICAIALWPVGFLNSAALALPFVFLLGDFTIHHFGGSLNRQIILRNVTILIVVIIIVSAASKWTP